MTDIVDSEKETSEPVETLPADEEPEMKENNNLKVAPLAEDDGGDVEQQTQPVVPPEAPAGGTPTKNPEETKEAEEGKTADPLAPEGGAAAAGGAPAGGVPAGAPPAGGGAAAPKKAAGPKKQINPKFKDVRETGKWGSVSKSEIMVVVAVFALVVIGVVVAVVLIVLRTNEDPPPYNGPPPTMAPTALSATVELSTLRDAIDAGDFTFPLLDTLSDKVEDYEGLHDDPSASPAERAMSWMLTQDTNNVPKDLVTRWTLAAVYYSLGGESWNLTTNWMSEESHCDWYGVDCDRFGELQELILKENNLAGPIPNELSLLTTMQVLWLSKNQLTGTLPGDMLGSIPRLSILYLDNNLLTGTVPASLRGNGVLQTLYLQTNGFTGLYPREFCPASAFAEAPLQNYGIDCDEVQCLCCGDYNCYYDD